MDFDIIIESLPLYFNGLWLTIKLVAASVIIGFIMAIPLAVMRTSKNWLVNGPVWAFTYFFRGTPLLIQMFMIYYGLGQLQFMMDLAQEYTIFSMHGSMPLLPSPSIPLVTRQRFSAGRSSKQTSAKSKPPRLAG